MEHRLTAPAIKAHLLLLFVELHFASIDFGVKRGDGSAIAFDLPAALKLKLVDERLEAFVGQGRQSVALIQRILEKSVNVILFPKANGQLLLKVVHDFLIFKTWMKA